MKCCCLVCWKLGLKGQNYSTQSNLIQSGLKGHSYHFLHPSHLFNINMYYQHDYKRVSIVIMTWAGMGLAGTGLVMFKPSTALRQASSEQPDPESSMKAKVVMFRSCIRKALIFYISSGFLQVFIKRLYPYFFHSR